MAEPIGLASGLLALTKFAFQCSVSLYETFKSFHSRQKRVRDLLDELEALSAVLASLADLVQNNSHINISSLELPLFRCGNACQEFQEFLLKYSSRSGGSRTSFRDWASLRYMGDDIDGFRNQLAAYKVTVNIALTDITLRQSSVTTEDLREHKELIQDAKEDLEARLESIDSKLGNIIGKDLALSDPDAADLQSLREERLSTEKCLQICAQLSDHISQIQVISDRAGTSHGSGGAETSPEGVTSQGLDDCKSSLAATVAKLERHMQDVMERLLAKSKKAVASEEESRDLERLRDEWETARQCLNICSKADSHWKEKVSVIENHGSGDALQFMVSANGKILHGTNRATGWRTRQVGGYMNDESIQQLSRDIAAFNLSHLRREGPDFKYSGNEGSPGHAGTAECETTAEFRERYGQGFKLSPEPSSEGAGPFPRPPGPTGGKV